MSESGASSRISWGERLVQGAFALIFAVAWAAAACDDAPPEPEPLPGRLVMTLVSPNGAEGAAVLATADAGIVDVTAEAPVQAFHWREGGVTRIVLLRDEPGEIRFSASVQDVNRPPRLEVVEIADGGNRLRTSLTDYEVDVEPHGGTGS